MNFVPRTVRLSVWTLLIVLYFNFNIVPANGQDATWRLNPVNQNWTTPLNWDPPTLPAGTAVFDQSTITSLTFPNTATIGTIQFNAGAPAYNFTLTGSNLNINGAGIVNNSSNRPTFSTFRVLVFRGTSKAGNAVIINPASGATQFFEMSSAENATITNSFGSTSFFNSSTAGNAIITNNEGGQTTFGSFSDPANPTTAGNATITTRNGGLTSFFNFSTGGSAQLITESGGTVDISGLRSGGMTAGSIAGTGGTFSLGSKALTVGLNDLSTEFSGTIEDGGLLGGAGGALIKVGTGTLTLSGDNTYTGGTTIMDGALKISADNNLGGTAGGLTFDGGTLQLGATFDLDPTRAITLNPGGGTLDTNGFDTTISQVITGSGATSLVYDQAE
jgi:autotransporter-associated beta strand protein